MHNISKLAKGRAFTRIEITQYYKRNQFKSNIFIDKIEYKMQF